jgi:hypothetical protein
MPRFGRDRAKPSASGRNEQELAKIGRLLDERGWTDYVIARMGDGSIFVKGRGVQLTERGAFELSEALVLTSEDLAG